MRYSSRPETYKNIRNNYEILKNLPVSFCVYDYSVENYEGYQYVKY
jgi:hypothetical protein